MVFLFLLCFWVQVNMAEQIITFFVHGIADSKKQALPFTKNSGKPYIIEGPLISFDLDCVHSYIRINMPYCSLGQENELEQIAHEWQKMIEQFPHADGFILIGVSRGASAIINFLGTYKPAKVKAVILESPFDTIEEVVSYRAHRWGVPATIIRNAIPLIFWQFNPHGLFPVHTIKLIDEDIPMLFVTVENDHSVPPTSALNLLNIRKQSGFINGYHLHLLSGRHGKLMAGPSATLYQNVVHAFYAHYQLPHNEIYAQEGLSDFSNLK